MPPQNNTRNMNKLEIGQVDFMTNCATINI